jgi:site-specific recombinase XerD
MHNILMITSGLPKSGSYLLESGRQWITSTYSALLNQVDYFRLRRHSLATFLVSRGKDVKTIQGLLRHAKVTTTPDLYSQSIDAAKLEA